MAKATKKTDETEVTADVTSSTMGELAPGDGVASPSANAGLVHSDPNAPASTRHDLTDSGVPMLPGSPNERQGPEDALGIGPKRGDYTNRIGDGAYNPHMTIIDPETGLTRLVPQRQNAENIGDVPGVKGGVETSLAGGPAMQFASQNTPFVQAATGMNKGQAANAEILDAAGLESVADTPSAANKAGADLPETNAAGVPIVYPATETGETDGDEPPSRFTSASGGPRGAVGSTSAETGTVRNASDLVTETDEHGNAKSDLTGGSTGSGSTSGSSGGSSSGSTGKGGSSSSTGTSGGSTGK